MKDLGNRLRELRQSAGLTQVALAEASGVPQPRISKYERGTRQPSLDTLRALAKVLGPITITGEEPTDGCDR